MADRNDHYIPKKNEYLSGGGQKEVPITPDDAHDVVLVREYNDAIEGRTDVARKLARALPDELNRVHGSWDWVYYPDDDGGDHWSRFDGERVIVDVEIRSENYRVVNEWKGRDEVRSSTVAKVFFNRQPVWEAQGRIPGLLVGLYNDIAKLKELIPLYDHITKGKGLIGRKVYYHNQPATIVRFLGDQGCVILTPESGEWQPYSHQLERDYDHDRYEAREDAKVEILSEHIWWWRDV